MQFLLDLETFKMVSGEIQSSSFVSLVSFINIYYSLETLLLADFAVVYIVFTN